MTTAELSSATAGVTGDGNERFGSQSVCADHSAAAHIDQTHLPVITTHRNHRGLRRVEGYAHREIAELLGINENTSKWRLAEAKKQLRASLTPQPPLPNGEGEQTHSRIVQPLMVRGTIL